VPYWQRAGQQASDRSAYLEAISHLSTGIELLKSLPETPEHTQQALTFSYGKNIHPASVRSLKGLRVCYLRLDWIDNHQPFLFGSLTQAGVRTDKVLGQATARQI